MDLRRIAKDISDSKYKLELKSEDPPLLVIDTISDVWPQMPPKGRLHAFVSVEEAGECFIRLFPPPQDI
jgi:hypothetical protein